MVGWQAGGTEARGASLLFMSKAGSTFHCFYWLGNQDKLAEAEVVKGQRLLPLWWGMRNVECHWRWDPDNEESSGGPWWAAMTHASGKYTENRCRMWDFISQNPGCNLLWKKGFYWNEWCSVLRVSDSFTPLRLTSFIHNVTESLTLLTLLQPRRERGCWELNPTENMNGESRAAATHS